MKEKCVCFLNITTIKDKKNSQLKLIFFSLYFFGYTKQLHKTVGTKAIQNSWNHGYTKQLGPRLNTTVGTIATQNSWDNGYTK